MKPCYPYVNYVLHRHLQRLLRRTKSIAKIDSFWSTPAFYIQIQTQRCTKWKWGPPPPPRPASMSLLTTTVPEFNCFYRQLNINIGAHLCPEPHDIGEKKPSHSTASGNVYIKIWIKIGHVPVAGAVWKPHDCGNACRILKFCQVPFSTQEGIRINRCLAVFIATSEDPHARYRWSTQNKEMQIRMLCHIQTAILVCRNAGFISSHMLHAQRNWLSSLQELITPTYNAMCYNEMDKYIDMYSGPSISSHSQQRPPSLMWPHIFGTTTMNTVICPSHQMVPLYCGHNFLANRVVL